MSYDYLLVRGEADPEMDAMLGELGDEEAALASVWVAAMANSIRTVDAVKAAISCVFPNVKWERSPVELPTGRAKSSPISDWGWHSLGRPECSLGIGENDQVHAISISYAERAEVEKLAATMGLRALDEQSLEVFGGV